MQTSAERSAKLRLTVVC